MQLIVFVKKREGKEGKKREGESQEHIYLAFLRVNLSKIGSQQKKKSNLLVKRKKQEQKIKNQKKPSSPLLLNDSPPSPPSSSVH